MNRVWIFTIVLALLAQTTELHEFVKLPILFQHYAEHQQRDSKLKFMEFLSMHYLGDDMNDDDNSRDMELPFKKVEVSHVPVHFLPPISGIKLKSAVFQIRLDHPEYLPLYTPNPALSGLFRPPRA
jgi:hypothetical protein